MATRPVPKYACQTRLTSARAVVGELAVDQPAGERQAVRRARPAGSGLQERRHARRHRLARLEEVAALEDVRRRAASSCACSTSCDEPSGCCFHSASISVVGVLPLGHRRPPVGEDGVDLRRRPLVARRRRGSARTSPAAGRPTASGCVGDGEAEAAEVVVLVVVAVPAAVVLRRAGTSAPPRSGTSIGFSKTNTALRGTLRRPGPTSMVQAVSSLPSMANATGPVTRFLLALVVEDRRRAAFPAG